MAELFGLEEIRDVLRGWMAQQIFRCIRLLERAVMHDGNAIRERDPVGQIMRHVQRCKAMLPVEG
jgi:hypothetical protein